MHKVYPQSDIHQELGSSGTLRLFDRLDKCLFKLQDGLACSDQNPSDCLAFFKTQVNGLQGNLRKALNNKRLIIGKT